MIGPSQILARNGAPDHQGKGPLNARYRSRPIHRRRTCVFIADMRFGGECSTSALAKLIAGLKDDDLPSAAPGRMAASAEQEIRS